ncbi:MAG TPA: hypothetical protein VI542_35020 [Candidatus Tectomicrobia bacterium]
MLVSLSLQGRVHVDYSSVSFLLSVNHVRLAAQHRRWLHQRQHPNRHGGRASA